MDPNLLTRYKQSCKYPMFALNAMPNRTLVEEAIVGGLVLLQVYLALLVCINMNVLKNAMHAHNCKNKMYLFFFKKKIPVGISRLQKFRVRGKKCL